MLLPNLPLAPTCRPSCCGFGEDLSHVSSSAYITLKSRVQLSRIGKLFTFLLSLPVFPSAGSEMSSDLHSARR